VSKAIRQNFFFLRERQLFARGKLLFFETTIDTNRDSAHRFQNEDSFATFSLKLEFLNEAEKEKNNGKGDSASVPSLFASLNNHF